MATNQKIFALVLSLPALAAAQSLPPAALAYDTAGNLYLADTAHNQVLEATLSGQLVLVAGNGTQGFSGDTGPAIAAQLNAPRGLALAADGTLYIADTGNHRIRTVSHGVITTLAGTGVPGYSGDNGPAAAAQLNRPTALALDASGALLLCDTANHRIRRISNAVITTLAGTGIQGFSGDGGPATSAQLDSPSGIATAAGIIYLADTRNHRIRRIDTATGLISTLAGTGVPGYSGDGGPALAAQLAYPQGLVLTAANTLLIADAANQRLRSVNLAATPPAIATLAGTGVQGTPTDAAPALTALNNPRSVALSAFSQPAVAATLLRVLAGSTLYAPAALAAPARTSNLTLTIPDTTYGQTTAALTVSGITPPQGSVQLLDTATTLAQSPLTNSAASFTLPALTAGPHTLTANYLGDGLNPAATTTATITITPAPTTITTAPPPAAYATQPLPLTATVASTTQGTPTGTVQFLDAATVIASATLTNGTATGVYPAPTTGAHTITAAYLGDANFLPQTSAAVTAIISPLPDFTLTPTTPSQTVAAGSIAVYTLSVTPLPTPFTGAVSFSVAGLPSGATASFSPPQLVPGNTPASTTLSITTPVTHVRLGTQTVSVLSALALLLILKKNRNRLVVTVLLLLPCTTLLGCGNRVGSAVSQSAQAYTLTVTATSTNLAGALVTHTTALTLTVH